MNDRIENTILNSLFFNEDFTRKVITFIKIIITFLKETRDCYS